MSHIPHTMMVWLPCCRPSRHDVLVGEHDVVVAHISYTAEHDAVGEVTRAVVIAGGVGSLFKSTITSQGHITAEQLLCEVETEKNLRHPTPGVGCRKAYWFCIYIKPESVIWIDVSTVFVLGRLCTSISKA